MPKPHIPNYTLCCTFGELEEFYKIVIAVENVKVRNIDALGGYLLAQSIRIKLGKKKEEHRLQGNKIVLNPLEAVTFWKILVKHYPTSANWKNEIIKPKLESLQIHFNEYIDAQ